ncbi:MAG: BrnA antitoxin family protein [Loktanella sp.]|jgi:uncharacterized protein (DUF4415 family)|nr:BrnA antitoxin family protein [Loktanella sp.]
MQNIKRITLDELRALKDAGKLPAPKQQFSDENLPDSFWENARIVMPKAKQPISLRVDPDILSYFKEQGDGHLTRMHAVLRAYVDAQRKRVG